MRCIKIFALGKFSIRIIFSIPELPFTKDDLRYLICKKISIVIIQCGYIVSRKEGICLYILRKTEKCNQRNDHNDSLSDQFHPATDDLSVVETYDVEERVKAGNYQHSEENDDGEGEVMGA